MRKSSSCPSLIAFTNTPSYSFLTNVTHEKKKQKMKKKMKMKEKNPMRAFMGEFAFTEMVDMNKFNDTYGNSAPSFLKSSSGILQNYNPFYYHAFHNVALCMTNTESDDIQSYPACLAAPPELHEEGIRERLKTEIDEILATRITSFRQKKKQNTEEDADEEDNDKDKIEKD